MCDKHFIYCFLTTVDGVWGVEHFDGHVDVSHDIDNDPVDVYKRQSHDYENLARFLLEMDWSWLGYTSDMDQCVLDWVKTRPWVQKNRIILSGFSLGTERCV